MQTLIVGDVHGCSSELEELLAEARLSPQTDQLVFVGDLVAKGPDSRGVLKLAQKWKARSVKGNHDAHVLKFRNGGEKEMKKQHLEVARSLDEADWRYLESMPLTLSLPGLIVVHAGLVPGIPLEEQDEEALINMRSLTPSGKWSKRIEAGVPWASLWPGPERVVFGHDAVRGLQQYPRALGLDTGCVYGKRLTGLLLPADAVISVKAHKVWAPVDA
jgi:diadenosine tetraphosphatase ApaH/serine/threonine PP2A family protein phosphatase